MSLTVAENESGLCYNSRIRYLEKSEVTKRKEISCPDMDDFKKSDQEPDVVWYKVTQHGVNCLFFFLNLKSLAGLGIEKGRDFISSFWYQIFH